MYFVCYLRSKLNKNCNSKNMVENKDKITKFIENKIGCILISKECDIMWCEKNTHFCGDIYARP